MPSTDNKNPAPTPGDQDDNPVPWPIALGIQRSVQGMSTAWSAFLAKAHGVKPPPVGSKEAMLSMDYIVQLSRQIKLKNLSGDERAPEEYKKLEEANQDYQDIIGAICEVKMTPEAFAEAKDWLAPRA